MGAQMDMDERRKNTRVTFHTTVDIRFRDADCIGCETRDLSVKGVFVLGVHGRTVGETCEVTLCLCGSSSELCMKMKGEVVRELEDGVALSFVEVDLDSFYHLKNIVYYNAEDPDRITEEIIS